MTLALLATAFSPDPLMPHLLDIISDPASEGLILAGGFGMRIKQRDLAMNEQTQTTLIQPVPSARATQDLDFFLRIELWMQAEKGRAVRAMLDRLSYTERVPKWQFQKPDPQFSDQTVKIDLLARHPRDEEGVKVREHRVGSKSLINLHGHDTPEAFAVEDKPKPMRIIGEGSDGTLVDKTVLVSHPYASLNMKVKAAHDWLRASRGEKKVKVNSEKHAFDVYILVAMLLEVETEECRELAAQYSGNPIAEENKGNAVELYGSPDAPGFIEVRRQIGELPYDYTTFWEGLCEVLGISPRLVTQSPAT